MSIQQQDEHYTETLQQRKPNSWTTVGLTKYRHQDPTYLSERFYVEAIIESKARPASVQLKRAVNLLIVSVLTTKHTACRIRFMLYPVLL